MFLQNSNTYFENKLLRFSLFSTAHGRAFRSLPVPVFFYRLGQVLSSRTLLVFQIMREDCDVSQKRESERVWWIEADVSIRHLNGNSCRAAH